MKKILSLLMAAALAVSLVACTSSLKDELKEPAGVSASSDTDASTDETSEETEESKAEQEPAKTEATISETVLLDESGVKITAKSLSEDELFGTELKLMIENNSGKDLTFQCRNSSVNGYMMDAMMSVDVADGKKANDAMTFMSSDLETCGIEAIADMEFSFHIFTTEDWDTHLDTPKIQLKTSIADSYEYKFDDSGDVAYEGNDIKIVVKGLSEDDSIFGPGIVVYLENNGKKDITVQARDVSVNGFMIDGIFSSSVASGKRAIDSITFMKSDLEENDITSIEDVELSFHIYDGDMETIADTDTVTITF